MSVAVSPAYTPNPAGNGVTTRAAYVDLSQTIAMIIAKSNEGRVDPAVRGWAGDVLIAAGRPSSNTGKMVALRDALRAATVFVPDPTGAEFIVGAAGTLCLRPGLCVRAADCDDNATVLLSAGNSIGIHCQLVEQHYGYDADGNPLQPHVFIVFEGEDGGGDYIYLDPSTDWAPGRAAEAVSETWHDPLALATPELIGVGADVSKWMPHRQVIRDARGWLEKSDGAWWRFTGAGWVPSNDYSAPAVKALIGSGVNPTPPVSWKQIDSSANVVAGRRYYFIAVVTNPHLDEALANDWDIEDSELGNIKIGYAPAYNFRGVAKTTAPKDTDEVQYLNFWEEAAGAVGAPGSPNQPSTPTTPVVPPALIPAPPPGPIQPDASAPSEATVSLPKVLMTAAVGAAIVGIGWGVWRHRRKRRRGRR